ncbi:MAG: hypothetical protein KF800_13405 [Lysobacter sp.]|nr:hypothetical protein [Lysobacter sp.]
MIRTSCLALLLLAPPCLLASLPARATLLAVDGDARSPDRARLLYRESHLIRQDGDRPLERLVLYRCPDGRAFARKRIDYRPSALAPDFELVDARGHREGLRREGGRVLVWSGDDAPRALPAPGAPLVADAGFDEYLRRHWTAATSGRPQRIAFAVPAYGRSLSFKVRGQPPRDAAGPHRFELRLDGVLGRLAPAIRVEYDDQRRLRRFVGLTNIRDARGDQVEAEIVFAGSPRAADPASWQAASGTPLAACALGG